MALSFLRTILQSGSKRRSAKGLRGRTRYCPRLERLEDRCVPATFTWTGDVSELWSNPANWEENGEPEAGAEADLDRNDVLRFPEQATRFSSVNDIKGTVHAAEIRVARNYNISGGIVRLDSATGRSAFTADSHFGVPNWAVNLELGVDTAFASGTDQDVQVAGILSGPGGVDKVGLGTVTLRAHNSYAGHTFVSNGILAVRENDALGATAEGTTVRESGTLKLRTSTAVGQEPLLLEGTLLGDFGSPSWAGPVTLPLGVSGSLFGRVRVDGVNVNLTLSGPVSGAGGLIKEGTGTLVFAGDAANSYTGITQVNEGRLDLNKTAGVHAVIGSVFVGVSSNGTPFGSGEVRLLNDDQIPNTVPLSFGPLGLLNLNGRSDTVGEMTLLGGRVTTGAGTLTLNGTVFATSVDPLGAEETTAALVEGNLALGSATRFFTVADGPATTDVTVAAVISGTGGLTKTGAGRLRLSGNNTYTGITTINASRLLVDGDQPSSPVEVNAGGMLLGIGTVGPLTVRAGGIVRPGSLTVAGNAFFGGSTSAFQPFLGPGVTTLGATGTLSLSNATLTVLDVNVPGGLTPLGVPIPIMGAASVGGKFNGLSNNNAIAVSVSGLPYRVTYTPNNVFVTRLSGPAFQDRAITPVIDEGGVATLTGRITTTEPGDKFFLEVNWGDGSRTQIHKVNSGAPRDVALKHRYLDDGVYTVGLLWRDQRGAFNTGTLQITVRNVAPTVLAGPDITLKPGGVLTRQGRALDPGARDVLTAAVDYGDGTGAQPLDVKPAGRFHLQHRYATPGRYTVVVTVRDDDGGVSTDSFVVTVTSRHSADSIAAVDAVFSGNLLANDRLTGRGLGQGAKKRTA